MASKVTRTQANRASLGCDETGDSDIRYHVNMEQNLSVEYFQHLVQAIICRFKTVQVKGDSTQRQQRVPNKVAGACNVYVKLQSCLLLISPPDKQLVEALETFFRNLTKHFLAQNSKKWEMASVPDEHHF